MPGTWIFIPPSGGGGNPYYGDPVSDVGDLPSTGLLGEVVYVITPNEFYAWDGTQWVLAPEYEPPIAPGTIYQYWRGDKTWQDLTSDVVLTSTDGGAIPSTSIGYTIASPDPVLSSVGIGATTVWGSATSLVVPAGRWMIHAIGYVAVGTANCSDIIMAGISTSPTPVSLPLKQTAAFSSLITGDFFTSLAIAPLVTSISAPETFYLVTKFIYNSGTPVHSGYITATRLS